MDKDEIIAAIAASNAQMAQSMQECLKTLTASNERLLASAAEAVQRFDDRLREQFATNTALATQLIAAREAKGIYPPPPTKTTDEPGKAS